VGYTLNSVLPPAAPEGQCLIRTSYMATHIKTQIDEAVAIIADVLKHLPTDEEEVKALFHKHHE